MSTQHFAIRIKHVSKIYKLWHSPHNRLTYYFKQIKAIFFKKKSSYKQQLTAAGYRTFQALSNIELEVRRGDSWGLVGENGSGKSTLLKIIAGNLRPSSGSVERNDKIVILDYSQGFNGDFTGRENIYIKALLLGLTRKQIKARYDAIVQFAGLGRFIDQPVKTYSSGMVARLGFAIVAHVDADIIISDEALAVGDTLFVQKCMHFLRNFLKKGTFLFVSHSVTDVISLCQNAVWLDHGAIKKMGPALAVATAYLNKMDDNGSNTDLTIENEKSLKKPKIILGSSATNHTRKPPISPQSSARYQSQPIHLYQVPLFEPNENQDIGGAKILQATLLNANSEPLSQITGGELVTLQVDTCAESLLISPIIGFHVLNRLGQILFEENTFLSYKDNPFQIEPDTTFTTTFSFQMPLLTVGQYVFRFFIATITSDKLVQIRHTLNNGLMITAITTGARHGIIGVPMHSIKLSASVCP